MFTVKWIVNTQSGELTRMFEAHEVAVAYRDTGPSVQHLPKGAPIEVPHWEIGGRFVDRQLLVLDPFESNFSGRSFDVGTVYVMNDAGATVGKYVLDGSVQPNVESLTVLPS